MFDPARSSSSYSGGLHGSGPVRGHDFGLDLVADDRAALVEYLRDL
jgi:hypothetical protein